MNNFLFLLYLYIGVFFVYVLTPYPEIVKKFPQLDQFKNFKN
jgi:hypothetical protein